MSEYPAEVDPFRRCFERAGLIADEPRYRLHLAQRYSYVLAEPHLLRAVASCAPLVEIGAGTGYWAYMLKQLGVDVVAYDRAPVSADLANRYHARTWEWHQVLEGTEAALARHSDRALFVCWPPRFSSLWSVLDFFFGDTIVYVGDGGERTARLAGLDRDYCEVERLDVTAMDAAVGWPAQLTIWRRRAGRRRRTASRLTMTHVSTGQGSATSASRWSNPCASSASPLEIGIHDAAECPFMLSGGLS